MLLLFGALWFAFFSHSIDDRLAFIQYRIYSRVSTDFSIIQIKFVWDTTCIQHFLWCIPSIISRHNLVFVFTFYQITHTFSSFPAPRLGRLSENFKECKTTNALNKSDDRMYWHVLMHVVCIVAEVFFLRLTRLCQPFNENSKAHIAPIDSYLPKTVLKDKQNMQRRWGQF